MSDGSVIITPSDDPVERRLILKEITAASGDASSKVAIAVVADPTSVVQISKISGVVSTLNSTAVTLGSGGAWTGTAENVTDYKSIGVNVIASHASATDGLIFQFSSDGTNWYSKTFTYPATIPKFFNLPVEAKWFKIGYTNSANIQTYFRLQTIYHASLTKESTLRLSEDIDGETAAQLGRMVICGQIDGTYKNVRLDSATGYMVTMEPSHHEVHEGEAFVACDVTDLANAAVRDILVVTPDTTKWAHMTITVTTEAETDMKFYAETTASANGTAIGAYNRNRNSATAATTLVFHTPTVAGGSEGTLIYALHWGSGKGSGGSDRASEEWILKRNRKYLLRITNATTSANQTSIVLNWYENAVI